MQTGFDGGEHLIGAKFRLKKAMLGMPAGSMGYVFNQYQDFDFSDAQGIQLIFSNGNYDGFSIKEQDMFLEFVEYDTRYTRYIFRNVIQVYMDYRSGCWQWD